MIFIPFSCSYHNINTIMNCHISKNSLELALEIGSFRLLVLNTTSIFPYKVKLLTVLLGEWSGSECFYGIRHHHHLASPHYIRLTDKFYLPY